MSIEVRSLPARDVSLIAAIDRSEHVDVEYEVIDGQLTQRPVSIREVPPWDPVGHGPHSVAAKTDSCASMIAGGGILLGAFDDALPLGLAVVNPVLEPRLAWLAFLHITRPHRRQGAASALWKAAVDLGLAAGSEAMYVSATPTGSAVGFYLRQGCRLADPVHPALFAEEPDDIHLICSLANT